MSINWIYRNVSEAWVSTKSVVDFWRKLQWAYAGKLPRLLRFDEQIIHFRFPPPLNELSFLVRSNGGSDQFIFGEVFFHRYYELPLLDPPDTILDLGAYAGFTAVYFSKRFPTAQIACVEPIPSNVRLLRRNCELNQVEANIIPAAVSTRDGELVMELNRMDYGHRVVDSRSTSHLTGMRVDAVSVPTMLQRLGWSHVGLLKVDIEGYERELFGHDCDWLQLVDALCIECHEGFRQADLQTLSRKYGFWQPRRLPGIWFLAR